MNKLFLSRSIIYRPAFILAIYILVAVVATILKISIDLRPHDVGNYTSKINNFIIYRNSFWHLVDHVNLYGYHPSEQYDEFLYSPVFAVLVAPFALLPKYVGVVFWCVFNVLAVFYAVRMLSVSDKKKAFILWFVLIELTTAIQNQQVNPLIAALFIFTYIAFEREKIAWAAFIIVLSSFIKVYGILGASLFLLYPGKLKFIAYSFIWTVILFCSPLLFISFQEMIVLYQGWFHTLIGDHAVNHDISVMRLFAAIVKPSNYEIWLSAVQVTAILLFCVKYIRVKAYQSDVFRAFFLSSIMIWAVIFSHAAESSTYIIAVCGVAIWYVHETKNKLNLALLLFVFLLTSLSPTDIFPRYIRVNYVVPMALKALPCLLIWIKCEYEMLFRNTLTK